jgi:hypothetical protein
MVLSIKKSVRAVISTMLVVGAPPIFGASTPTLLTPKHYPASGSGLEKEFDWQEAWGTVHINSLADKLQDPMIPATQNGIIYSKGAVIEQFSRFQQLTPELRDNIPQMGGCDVTKSSTPCKGSFITGGQLAHGIKFDFKNSILNCMSRPLPTFAMNRGSYSGGKSYGQGNVCGVYGVESMQKDPATIVFTPLWDARGNDTRTENDTGPGCLQQVTNNCARDMHECRKPRVAASGQKGPFVDGEGKGYLHPVTHFFSQEEVMDLCGSPNGCALPLEYYVYEKITALGAPVTGASTKPTAPFVNLQTVEQSSGAGDSVSSMSTSTPKVTYSYTPIQTSRQALSRDPNPSDQVPGTTVTKVDNRRDPNLARIKTYTITNTDPYEDKSSFIIADPSGFFDLNLYTKGKAHDSGFNQFDSKGLVQTLDTCPILGVANGYSGICDPTGNAGCNLAIYGVGPETEFQDSAGKKFTYNHYPIRWSGYVKKWSFISVAQYLENVKNRVRNGQNVYTGREYLNDNPIMMLTRANEYCDAWERSSDLSPQVPVPDMPCIHYVQYQAVDETGSKYGFVNLYSPSADITDKLEVSYTSMKLYHLKKDGTPDPEKPILVQEEDKTWRAITFRDAAATYSRAGQSYQDGKEPKAITKADFTVSGRRTLVPSKDGKGVEQVGGMTVNTSGMPAPGEFLGVFDTKFTAAEIKSGAISEDSLKALVSKGSGIKLEPGTSIMVRVTKKSTDGTNDQTACSVVTYDVPKSKNEQGQLVVVNAPRYFVPTNSFAEFDSFVKASAPPVDGKIAEGSLASLIRSRPCNARFLPNSEPTAAKLTGGQKVAKIVDEVTKEDIPTGTWFGEMDCKQISEPAGCNQTKMIVGRRYCQLEDDGLGDCSLCNSLPEPDAKLSLTDHSVAGAILNHPMLNTKGTNRCLFRAMCFNRNAASCPLASSSGGHIFCFGPETRIMLADGGEIEIEKIRAGDEILAFDAKFSKSGALKPARVKATAITKDQKILKINELRVTPLHKIVLQSGRAVLAEELKIGDKILKADGSVEEVASIENGLKPITVYNLVLEDGKEGYIANGMRVLSYPVLKGMGGK